MVVATGKGSYCALFRVKKMKSLELILLCDLFSTLNLTFKENSSRGAQVTL